MFRKCFRGFILFELLFVVDTFASLFFCFLQVNKHRKMEDRVVVLTPRGVSKLTNRYKEMRVIPISRVRFLPEVYSGFHQTSMMERYVEIVND